MVSMRMRTAALAASLATTVAGTTVASGPAAAEIPQRGSAGLVEVPFSVANATDAATIACAASIAHWYSLELGRAAPGVRLETTLWADPGSGAVYILNGHADRLPVERLWCGLAGRSWQTRAPIDLARRAGEAQRPIRLACTAPAGGRLGCAPR